MICQVVLWQNGMVMTRDESGDQLSEYQGRLGEMGAKILRDAPPSAVFQAGEWRDGAPSKFTTMRRDLFAMLVGRAVG